MAKESKRVKVDKLHELYLSSEQYIHGNDRINSNRWVNRYHSWIYQSHRILLIDPENLTLRVTPLPHYNTYSISQVAAIRRINNVLGDLDSEYRLGLEYVNPENKIKWYTPQIITHSRLSGRRMYPYSSDVLTFSLSTQTPTLLNEPQLIINNTQTLEQ